MGLVRELADGSPSISQMDDETDIDGHWLSLAGMLDLAFPGSSSSRGISAPICADGVFCR